MIPCSLQKGYHLRISRKEINIPQAFNVNNDEQYWQNKKEYNRCIPFVTCQFVQI